MMHSSRRGIFGADVLPQPGAMPIAPAAVAPEQARPLSTGRMIAGGIGDALLQWSGARPVFAPLIAQRQQQAAELAAEQRQRANGFADWQAREQWKLDNPSPVNNDTINDFNWYKSLSPQDRQVYQEMKPVYRQGPDGQFYRVDTAPPPAAPPSITLDQWNAAQPAGGPTPRASGGFR